MGKSRAGVAVVFLSLGLLGCALIPGANEPTARDADEKFELVLSLGSTRYGVNEPIGATATLSYLGPDAGIDLVGSGTGIITFAARQLDGRLEISGGGTADCKPYRVDKGRPLVVPYEKSGGWSADGPDAEFYKAFFADPIFRLPRGTWRISAAAMFTEEECGGVPHALGADVTIVVE